MKRMFVIYGEQNSGKTHAMWLLLSYLLQHEANIINLFHANAPLSYREIVTTKEQLTDFRAIVSWRNKTIMLLSAGDYLDGDKDWSFRKHMKEAEIAPVDYIVCCARQAGTDVYNELKERYEGNILPKNNWYHLGHNDNESEWMIDCDKTALEVLRDLHEEIAPNEENHFVSNILKHQRVLFPVGQGGFAFERIDDCNVIFDCGSLSSPTRLGMYIDLLRGEYGIHKIDYLFISHFDQDHVNGIKMLLNAGIQICASVVSNIRNDMRYVYDVITRGAYFEIMRLLGDGEIIPIAADGNQWGRSFKHKDIWEWIAKSMLHDEDFEPLKQMLLASGLDETKLTNPEYLAQHTDEINDAYKEAFKSRGPNATGLIMLSQRVKDTALVHAEITQGCRDWYCPSWCCRHIERDRFAYRTGCLFVGDARIKTQKEINEINSFLNAYKSEEHLLLMQLPHHGSQYNICYDLHKKIISDLYFVCDSTSERIEKSQQLYDDLTHNDQLLMVRDICPDLIFGRSYVIP